MAKFNLKIVNPIIFGLTLAVGVFGIMYNHWFILGVIVLFIGFIYCQNRSDRIKHYSLGVDLDSNEQGDILELYLYAFKGEHGGFYRPIAIYRKQINLYVNVVLLDTFYESIGYEIVEDKIFNIRKVNAVDYDSIVAAKKAYKEMIKAVNYSIRMSAGSMMATNLQQPLKQSTTPRLPRRFLRLSFK